jgi:hypothetical protein
VIKKIKNKTKNEKMKIERKGRTSYIANEEPLTLCRWLHCFGNLV